MDNGNRTSLIAWVRDVAVVGAAWALSGTINRVEAKVDHTAYLVERNAQAIERNAQAIERNAQAIAKLQESMASLAGQYAEHIRRHDQLADR